MQQTIEISGMSCGHCVNAVREALQQVEGLNVLDVGIGTAVVEYDPAEVQEKDFLAVIEEEGYAVRV
jgi:copper chaperone